MEKLKYERPSIIRHAPGLANKFGRAQTAPVKKFIDGVSVNELTEKYGSPLFAFSESVIRSTYRDAFRVFSNRYPKVQFAWSYKTNYLDAVCKIFHEEGSWAEVVSEYEYEMARRNGVPGDRILYNGPYKPYDALRTAIQEGARIHIDHFDELYMIEKIADELGQTVGVTIRMNMDTGIYPQWDRFGFNLDNGEALNVARRIQAGGKVKLTGLHAHIGTFVLEPFAYKNQTCKLADFARELEKEFGFVIEYLDVGGGFPSKNTLHSQYAPGKEANPSIETYAEAITSALLEKGFPPDKLPVLMLETGRALVDDAGYLITTIIGNKRLANGTRIYIVDAGVNTLFTAFWYNHEVMPTREKEGMFEETAIYGPLCMNIDVVRPSIRLPAMETGEQLVIHPVGAYNVTQWMQFIRMRPAIALIGENREVSLIREAETIDTLKSLEHVPDRLKS